MLHDGKKFDVGETGIVHVIRQLHGQFAVSQPAVVLFRHASPRTEVNFVDGNR